MKKILLIALTALFCQAAVAQTRVAGTVTSSDDGTPVSFATIVVKGNNRLITSTDVDGKYVLDIPNNAVLVVSSIGFTTVEVPIGGRTVVNIVLSPDVLALEEVMVVAYGTVRKGSYSGSATVVRSESIRDVPALNIEQALAGAVPGMQVSQASGQPGSLPQIRLRGVGSFNASNEPLYVIDGIPVTSGSISQANITTSTMNFLDPGNIETITVLKDAAAASLYGSRAANGVILITTKSGKQGKAITNFRANYGFSNFAVDNYPLCTEEEQEMLVREMVWNYGNDNSSLWNNATYNFSLDEYVNRRTEVYYPARKPGYEYVDWKKILLRTATAQNYEASISGGNADSKVFASVSYTKTEGTSRLAQMDRISANMNASHKMSKAISLGGNMQYALTDQDGFQEGSGQRDNPWYAVVAKLTARFPYKNPDGSYWLESYDGTAFRNPANDMDKQIANSKQSRALLRGWVEAEIVKGLKLKSTLGYDISRSDDRFAWLVGHQYGLVYGNGYVGDRYRKQERVVSSTTLNFNKSFRDAHNFAVMVGWEAEQMKRQTTDVSKVNFANYNLTSTDAATDVRAAYTTNDEVAMLSLLSSLNYDYKGKYYLTGTFRRDGSSRLGPETRWGNFWSLSGSWRLINEPFIKSISWIGDLKIRGSYGINATLPSGFYSWQTLYGYGKYGGDSSSAPSSYADRGLTWETNYTWNLALEGRVFDKFAFIAEYYNRETKDLLLGASIPSITGFSSTTTNIGSMLNSGIELTLNVNIIKKKDLKWDVGLNWSTLHNEILSMSEDGETIVSAPYIRTAGYSYYQYYTREFLGADPKNGAPMYYKNTPLDSEKGIFGPLDKDITNTTSNASSAILEGKTGLPKGFGGINTNVSYKGLSLSLHFNYQYGNYIWDGATLQIRHDGYSPYNNMSKDMLKRWQKEGDVTDIPKPTISTQSRAYNSTAWLYKGDFIRLKNMTLSYNLPQNIISSASLRTARVYVSGLNLLTFSGLDFDPEVPIGSYFSFTMPPMRTITFGVEISF